MKYVNSKSRSYIWRGIYCGAIVFGLAAIVIFLAFSNWNIFQKLKTSIDFRQTAEVNLKDQTDMENQLQAKVSELQTENGLEKEIRERYPVAKPGEEVIMIVPDNNAEATTAYNVNQDGGWWQRFLKWLNL